MSYLRLGMISSIDELTVLTKKNIPYRESLREQVPNQKHTRNKIALYDILDGIYGFGDKELFESYYPFVKEVAATLEREYGYSCTQFKSLMIVKLLASEKIAEHIDEAGIYKHAHRVHIPIITNDGCIFTVGGDKFSMATGEMVEIDNTISHSVVNGDKDRVHLIMDIIGLHAGYDSKVLKNRIPEQFYIGE